MTGSQYPQPPGQQPQYQPLPQEQPYTFAPPEKKLPIGKIIAVLIVVGIVIAVIAVASIIYVGLQQRATLSVSVTNYNHYSVEYDLYVDGDLEASDTLPAVHVVQYTITKFPGPDCKTYEVSVTATGGGGTESDSETVTLCAGETETVSLRV